MPAQWALMVRLARRARRGLKVRKEAKEVEAVLVHWEPLARVVRKGSVVLRVPLVHRGLRVPQAILVQRARRDLQERSVCLGSQAV